MATILGELLVPFVSRSRVCNPQFSAANLSAEPCRCLSQLWWKSISPAVINNLYFLLASPGTNSIKYKYKAITWQKRQKLFICAAYINTSCRGAIGHAADLRAALLCCVVLPRRVGCRAAACPCCVSALMEDSPPAAVRLRGALTGVRLT